MGAILHHHHYVIVELYRIINNTLDSALKKSKKLCIPAHYQPARETIQLLIDKIKGKCNKDVRQRLIDFLVHQLANFR